MIRSALAVVALVAAGLPRAGAAQDTAAFVEYAAKFVCGTAPPLRSVPGRYLTEINIHNPGPEATRFRYKVALTGSGGRPGPITPFASTGMRGDEAIAITCAEIERLARAANAPWPAEGFVVVLSSVELDVVALYTAGPTRVEALHTQRVPPRRFGRIVTACADLVVDSIMRPEWDANNRRSVIRAVIRNIGDAPAAPTTARVIDPTTTQPSGAPESAIASTPALGPGASTVVTFYLSYWVYNPDVTLEVTADYKNELVECREDNNTRQFTGIG